MDGLVRAAFAACPHLFDLSLLLSSPPPARLTYRLAKDRSGFRLTWRRIERPVDGTFLLLHLTPFLR